MGLDGRSRSDAAGADGEHGRRLRVGAWPLAAAVATVVVGMAYSLWWGPVVYHADIWITPGDIWGTMRAAHLVAWGGAATIYTHGTLLDAFPGIAVLLAPVAKIADLLHLSESFPILLPHPSGWLLEGPVEIALGTFALFPLDDLARRLGVSGARRVCLVWLEAMLCWPVTAMWGHPEDLLALGFAVYGLMAAFDGRSTRCATMFAAAVVFQPLVIALIPLALVHFPWRRWLRMVGLMALPPFVLLVVPLAYAWHATIRAVVTQPTFPGVDHPTPWLSLAPVLDRYRSGRSAVVGSNPLPHGTLVTVVGAGHARAVAVAVLAGLALWLVRHRPPLTIVVWIGAVALGCRCLFDPVLCPYYAVPSLALALLLAAGRGWRRLWLTVALCAASTWAIYRHAGPWSYFAVLAAGLVATWLVSVPVRTTASQRNAAPVVARQVAPDTTPPTPQVVSAGA